MSGPTRIRVELREGRARFARLDHSEYLSPRPLGTEGITARVALVAGCATLLAGDAVELAVEIGPGAELEICEPAGTVAYNARGGSASWTARVRVASGARLTWTGAPFVVAAGAAVERGIHIRLGAGAVALIRECLVLGRAGEPHGGALRTRLRADLDGRPLLVEELDLRTDADRRAPGVLDGARVLATAALLGAAPPAADVLPSGAYETRLAGPGALARALGTEAHQALGALDPIWCRWRAGV